MPFWILTCPHCGKNFAHSEIATTAFVDYYLPRKPEFPTGGLNMTCPSCKKISLFQRHQLVYQRD